MVNHTEQSTSTHGSAWVTSGKVVIPAVASDFFNSIPSGRFVDIVDQLLQREDIFLGEGAVGCCFEENYDPGWAQGLPEDPIYRSFPGVRFSLRVRDTDPLEAVFVNFDTFSKYLLTACEAFVRQAPEKKQEVLSVFAKNNLPLS